MVKGKARGCSWASGDDTSLRQDCVPHLSQVKVTDRVRREESDSLLEVSSLSLSSLVTVRLPSSSPEA